MRNNASRYKIVIEVLNDFGETMDDMLNIDNKELSNFFNSKKGMCLLMYKMYLLKEEKFYKELAENILEELPNEEKMEIATVVIELTNSKNKEKGISRIKKGNE